MADPFGGVYGASKKDLNRSMTSAELRGRLGNNLLTFTPYYSREQSDNYKVGTESEYRNSSSVSTSWGAILQDELRFDVHRLVLGLDTRNQDTDTRSFKADGSSAVPYQPNVSTRGLGSSLKVTSACSLMPSISLLVCALTL